MASLAAAAFGQARRMIAPEDLRRLNSAGSLAAAAFDQARRMFAPEDLRYLNSVTSLLQPRLTGRAVGFARLSSAGSMVAATTMLLGI